MRIWHCRTQEEYDHLMKQLEAEGCKWGNLGTFNENLWASFKEHMCVREKGGKLFCCTRGFYEAEYPDVKIQPVVIPEPTPADSIKELVKQDKENKKMNKQKLMEKLHKLPTYGYNSEILKQEMIDLVEQLDEPQKVVLPKDMAEWLEDTVIHYDLAELLEEFSQQWFADDRLAVDFVENHCESLDHACCKIARAYLDGYEVEKEKLYTVVLPNPKCTTSRHKSFLRRTDKGNIVLVQRDFMIADNTKLTEEEIKSLDERYMAFAQEVAE